MKNLALRNNVDILFDSIEKSKENKVLLDFKDIQFMSRSFAQQYILRKKTCKKEVEERNIEENVANMFKIVKNQKMKSHFLARDFEIIEVTSISAQQ